MYFFKNAKVSKMSEHLTKNDILPDFLPKCKNDLHIALYHHIMTIRWTVLRQTDIIYQSGKAQYPLYSYNIDNRGARTGLDNCGAGTEEVGFERGSK